MARKAFGSPRLLPWLWRIIPCPFVDRRMVPSGSSAAQITLCLSLGRLTTPSPGVHIQKPRDVQTAMLPLRSRLSECTRALSAAWAFTRGLCLSAMSRAQSPLSRVPT